MTVKVMKIRVTKAGGHFDITFWTGMIGYTFANIGTLTMDESDMWLLLEVLSKDERVISIERDDLIPRGGGDENSKASPDTDTPPPLEGDSMNDTRRIIEKADLGIVELVWLTVAMDAFILRDEPLQFSVETVSLIPWEKMLLALDMWEQVEDFPNHLDVIHKMRAASESLKGE